MTTIDTAPNPTPPAPEVCVTAVHTAYYASCRTHGVAQLGRHINRRAALREFHCDLGAGWRFFVEYGPGEPPFVFDLTELVARVYADKAAAAIGVDDEPPATIWRWVGEGRTEPITVQKVPGTGDWVRDPDNDQTAPTAYPEYAITGPDGTVYARVVVAVDGAA